MPQIMGRRLVHRIQGDHVCASPRRTRTYRRLFRVVDLTPALCLDMNRALGFRRAIFFGFDVAITFHVYVIAMHLHR